MLKLKIVEFAVSRTAVLNSHPGVKRGMDAPEISARRIRVAFRCELLGFVFLLLSGACASNCDANDREQAREFFKSFCVSCHGTETAESDLRLDQFDVKQWNDPGLLEKIYAAIERGEMPPDDAARHPKSGQSKALQTRLGNQLRGLAEKQKPGMLKRLSRVEYQNTVNDVFGTNFTLTDRLPLDNIDAGFDNNADNLHMSAVDMEAYFNVANQIAESVVSDKPAPRVVVYSTKNTDIDTHSQNLM